MADDGRAAPPLPDPVNRFIAQRQARGDVSAVLLYGSYARGTQHEHSDVDLIFIVDEGFTSELVVVEGLDVEVLEQTKTNMIAFWQKNLDEDRHWYLWKDVKVVFDRDGEGVEVIEHAMSLVGEKQPWPSNQVAMRKQVTLAKLHRTRQLATLDPGTAAILLVEIVQGLTEHWFSVRGRRIPSSKEFVGLFADESPEFGGLLESFHLEPSDLDSNLDHVERMVAVVYG